MKLLSPAQNTAVKDQHVMREILRTQEMDKASQRARLNLAQAEVEFNATLAKHRQAWATEEEDHARRVKEMTEELSVLENRRKNALVPIEQLRKEADTMLAEAIDYLAKLKVREEQNDVLSDKLEDRLDEVGKREQDLIQKEKILSIREQGIEIQSQSIVTASKKLSEDMLAFNALKEREEKDIERRKTDIALIETSLIAKEKTLERTNQSLTELSIRLADERSNLQKIWDEIERKKLISP